MYIVANYETGKAHTLTSWSYVRDEDNVSAKIGVISAGGLLALLIGGRRKGIIKKLFYTSLGVGGVASLVYPKESKKISQELFNNAGDYSVIAYNFIAGVKPQGENQTPSKSPQESQKPKNIPPKTEVSMNIGSSVDSFQSLASQASDVTIWGFRLFDRSDVSSSSESEDSCSMVTNNEVGVNDYQKLSVNGSLSTIFDDKMVSHKQNESLKAFETEDLNTSHFPETSNFDLYHSPSSGINETKNSKSSPTPETSNFESYRSPSSGMNETKDSKSSPTPETSNFESYRSPSSGINETKDSKSSPTPETSNFDSYHSPSNGINETKDSKSSPTPETSNFESYRSPSSGTNETKDSKSSPTPETSNFDSYHSPSDPTSIHIIRHPME
ncbi:hypothetical protein Avbf_03682 [Armadillidium vulgare]|nr:hypothetical protein Avbf_03682 [Armadillidium vulgare]